MKRGRVYAVAVAKVAISALLLWLILRHLDVGLILARLRDVDSAKVLLAVLIAIGGVLIAALRWQILSGSMLPFSGAMKYTWIGFFWGAILPGGISGDVAKGASLALKDPRKRVLNLPVSILLDRVAGLFTLLLFFNVGCALMTWGNYHSGDKLREWTFNGFFLSAVALLCCVLVAMPTTRGLALAAVKRIPLARVRVALERTMEEVFRYFTHPRPLVYSFLLSLAIHALSVVQYILMAQALQIEMSLPVAVAFYSIISLAILAPVTISGVGVREWICLLFFTSLGFSAVAAIAFAWLQLLGGLLLAAIGAVVQVMDLFQAKQTQRIVMADDPSIAER